MGRVEIFAKRSPSAITAGSYGSEFTDFMAVVDRAYVIHYLAHGLRSLAARSNDALGSASRVST